MAELSINSAQTSDMTNRVEDVVVDPKTLDSPSMLKETEWINSKWNQYLGYYKTIPEVKIAIDMRAVWTIGNEVQTDNGTKVILDHLSGWGQDTFKSILKNLLVCKRVGGDAFAEIIKDEESDTLINLKPLDPSKVRIIVNSKGVIIRYEQINREGKALQTFKPSQIFHISNKRIGDEIHGVSDIEAIEEIIKANKESFTDMKQIMHRFVKPKLMVALDTDDPVKIDAFVTKFDDATNKGENLFYPKDSVETPQVLAVPANATMNPLPWREHLRTYFFQVVGIPQIIMGSSGEFTESTAKIAYVAFQQSVKDEQRDTEEQIFDQLGLDIKLTIPTEIRNELLTDEAKDGQNARMGFQSNDTTAGVGE